MLRAFLIAALVVFAPLALPTAVTAASGKSAEQSRTGQNCDQQNQRSRRRGRGIGGFLGGIAGGVIGGPVGTVASVLPVGSMLGEAIAGLLDCHEQQQAAAATDEATRGGVGTTSTWQSETRANVSGSSTVTAAEPVVASTGRQCLTVTDVVIIDGEETRAPKRMCRTPPSNRYERV